MTNSHLLLCLNFLDTGWKPVHSSLWSLFLRSKQAPFRQQSGSSIIRMPFPSEPQNILTRNLYIRFLPWPGVITSSSSRSWTKSASMYCSTNSSISSHRHWHSGHAKSQHSQKMRFPQPTTSDSTMSRSIQVGHGTWLHGSGLVFTGGDPTELMVDCCVVRCLQRRGEAILHYRSRMTTSTCSRCTM